jgi:hypothetical protein
MIMFSAYGAEKNKKKPCLRAVQILFRYLSGVAGYDFPVFCVPVGQSSEKKVVGAPVNPGLVEPSDLAIGCDSSVPVSSEWGPRKVFC